MRKLITHVLLLVFSISLSPLASARLHWQLPQLQNHEQGLKLRLKAQPVGSQIRSGTAPESPITITARAGQVFTVCSQQVKTDANSTLLIAYDQTKIPPHQLILTHWQTTLYFEKPYICPTEDIKQLPYDYQGVLYSQEPFLVSRQEDPKKKKQDKNSLIPSIGLPKMSSSQNLLTGDTGSDSDDDSFFKYPFQPPYVDRSDITMVLLPFLKLPPGWKHQVPGSQWFHWLIGEPDYDSGAILNIQVNGESIARLPIYAWELQELAEDLTNSHQLLQKLIYKLNGREALVHQLLDILATGDQSPMDEETRERIEQQLADVLEQSDRKFSLELEWFSLQKTLFPENAILTAKGEKNKKQGTGSGKSSDGSDQNQEGATGSDQPSQSDRDSQEPPSEQNASNNPSPSGGKNDSQQTDASTGNELTITFVGRFNAGKSSLASALLGGRLFPSDESRTEEDEPDVIITPNPDTPLERMRVRSLPGYGDGRIKRWFKQNLIASDEVIVFVLRNTLLEHDEKVLEWLKNSGHSLSQIIFVRNQFDKDLEAKIIKRQLKDSITDEEKKIIAAQLQKTLEAEFCESMEEFMKEFFDDETFNCPELHFTSCRNIYQCEGLESAYLAPEVNQELHAPGSSSQAEDSAIQRHSLLQALENNIHQKFSRQARSIWDRFLTFRNHILKGKRNHYMDVFRDVFRSEQPIAYTVLQKVLRIESGQIPIKDSSLPLGAGKLMGHFWKEHNFDLEDEVARLRKLSTWDATESEMINLHAEALVRKSKKDQERYLNYLQEKTYLHSRKALTDSLLQDLLDFSANFKAAEFVHGLRKPMLAAIKRQMWFWEKWGNSDDELLERFRQQLSRAIDAELLIARYRRMLPASVKETDLLPDMAPDTEPFVPSRTFQEGWQAQVDELAGQFTSILLSEVILPAYYHLPEPDTPLQETPQQTRSETSTTPPTAPSSTSGQSDSRPILPVALDNPQIPPSEESLEEIAEQISARFAELAENKVSVTLPNGFQKQYIIDPPAFFTVNELGAVLTAFASQGDRAQAHKGSLIVASGGQEPHQFHYLIDSVKRFRGTYLNRVRVQTIDTSQRASAPVEIWINFELNSDQNSEKSALSSLTNKLRLMESQSFAPRAFVYASDTLSESPLLITRAPPVNLAQLLIMQNDSTGGADRLLADLKTFSRRQPLTDPEMIELALKLLTGLKSLDSQQLSLGILDVAYIGVDPDHWQPYPDELSILRQHTPDSPDQAMSDFILQQETGASFPSDGQADGETQASLKIKWLGQVFILLSGQSPIFYQKEIVSRADPEAVADNKKYLDAFDERQLKSHVSDLLVRSGIKPNLIGNYPDVNRKYSATQNLLLMARHMLRSNPKKRPSLDKIIEMLRKIQPMEPVDES